MKRDLLSDEAVRERLAEVLKRQNITVITLGDDDLNLRQRLYSQILYNKKLSVEVALVFLSYFPNLSAEWVFRGKGEMFTTDDNQQQENTNNEKQTEIHLISLENLANRVSRLEAEVFKI